MNSLYKPGTFQKVVARERCSRSFLSPLFLRMYQYPRLRKSALSFVRRLECGDFYSQTLRQAFNDYHNVKVGRYSYGCFIPKSFPEGTQVGSYVSIAENVTCLRRNHPYSRLSQHPFFYNKHLQIVDSDTINNNIDNPLIIGSDVWIGCNSIILPSCRSIGNGAIIGAGSVVTKDIPSFSIFAGIPAKLIKMRFPENIIRLLDSSAWWERPLADLIASDFPCLDDASENSIRQWITRLC